MDSGQSLELKPQVSQKEGRRWGGRDMEESGMAVRLGRFPPPRGWILRLVLAADRWRAGRHLGATRPPGVVAVRRGVPAPTSCRQRAAQMFRAGDICAGPSAAGSMCRAASGVPRLGRRQGRLGPFVWATRLSPAPTAGGTWEAEVRMAGTVLGVGSVLLESSDINHFLEGERAGGPTPDAWGSRFANLHLQACARRSSCRECPAHSSRPFSQHVCSEHLLCTAHSSGHQEDGPDQNSPPPRNP